jgi:hypothetical protein
MNPKDVIPTPGADLRDVFDGNGIKPSTWLHLVCYALLIVVLGIALKSWSDERVGRAVAESSSRTEKIVREQAKAERDAEVKALKDEMAQVKTTPQAVKVIEHYIPQAAPVATVERSQIAPEVVLPDAPGKLTIRTQPQEIAVAQTVSDFQVCKSDLKQCSADKESLTRDRDKWETAAKGGTKGQRFKGFLKSALCGGGGAAAGAATTKGSAKGAAIGAIGGMALCHLL